jgi:hypothetical protein
MLRFYGLIFLVLAFARALPADCSDQPRSLPYNSIPVHEFFGKFESLVDVKGRTILPAKFARIIYQGNEIFAADRIDKNNPQKWDKRLLFNKRGTQIKYRIPSNAQLLEVYSISEKLDSEPNLPVKSLPKDSLLLFLDDKQQRGLCHPDGTIFLPAQKNIVICYLKPGFGYISNGSYNAGHPDKIINLTNGESTDTEPENAPSQATTRLNFKSDRYLHPEFKYSFSPPVVPKIAAASNVSFEKISEQCLKKIVNPDDGRFNPKLWRSQKVVTRPVLFERLLREYDLIGMSTDKVLELLGSQGNAGFGDGVAWDNYRGDLRTLIQSFGGGGCVPQMSLHFQINFKDDRVVSWQFLNGVPDGQESQSITENVLIPSWYKEPHITESRLKNARIGEQSSRLYPDTVAKYH